jgi:hypothetical protein
VRYYFPSLLLTACNISSLYLILKSQIKFPLQILRKRRTYGVNNKYRYVHNYWFDCNGRKITWRTNVCNTKLILGRSKINRYCLCVYVLTRSYICGDVLSKVYFEKIPLIIEKKIKTNPDLPWGTTLSVICISIVQKIYLKKNYATCEVLN